MTHLIGWPNDPMLTNALVYRAIALEALEASERDLAAGTLRDGQTLITTLDPGQTSFKQSLVSIVFAGMYMEAKLWQTGCKRLGMNKYEKVDRMQLELRLNPLGIEDAALRQALERYREVRRSLVHEKAVPAHLDRSPSGTGQEEARNACKTMAQLDDAITRLAP